MVPGFRVDKEVDKVRQRDSMQAKPSPIRTQT